MSEPAVILRRWSARIRTEDEQAYLEYVEQTAGRDFASTPGNLGHQILIRTLREGISEITTMSWWRDMDAVRLFAGPRPELSRVYPEDGRYLLGRPEQVEHHYVYLNDVGLGDDRQV